MAATVAEPYGGAAIGVPRRAPGGAGFGVKTRGLKDRAPPRARRRRPGGTPGTSGGAVPEKSPECPPDSGHRRTCKDATGRSWASMTSGPHERGCVKFHFVHRFTKGLT
ncbi:hypothetical protein GCM10027187_03990 [Streptosporangium sandarakinum]